MTSSPPTPNELLQTQAIQLNDLQNLYQISQAKLTELIQENQLLKTQQHHTTYTQYTIALFKKRIQQLAQERDMLIHKQPTKPKTLSYQQLSNHLKLKPIPILKEPYSRAGTYVQLKVEKMVENRWSQHLAELQKS